LAQAIVTFKLICSIPGTAPFSRMATIEIAQIAEKPNGAAFEVKIKGQVNESAKSAAQARLESYGMNPLPSLLQSRALAPKPQNDRADKARRQNEQKREAAERLRAELDNSMKAKREGLQQSLEKAKENREEALAGRKARAGQHFEKVMTRNGECQQRQAEEVKAFEGLAQSLEQKAKENREEALAGRKARAGQHFEKVMTRSGECQQRQAEEMKALRQRLEEDQEQKGASLAASLNQRMSRANQHNEAVAGKVLQHQEHIERHTAECRAATPAERFSRLSERLYEHFYVARPR